MGDSGFGGFSSGGFGGAGIDVEDIFRMFGGAGGGRLNLTSLFLFKFYL